MWSKSSIQRDPFLEEVKHLENLIDTQEEELGKKDEEIHEVKFKLNCVKKHIENMLKKISKNKISEMKIEKMIYKCLEIINEQ